MSIDQENSELELKEHYVYLLMDPSDKTIFYVGKGTGRRIENHVKEAINCDDKESAKLNKIREILAREHMPFPDQIVIARFDTAAEAFAVEAVLIHWVYGHKSDMEEYSDEITLTNIQPGHGRDTIRIKGQYYEFPGIDIPKYVRIYDGTYTSRQKDGIELNDVERKLSTLRSYIALPNPEWLISDVDMSRPKDPSVFINVGNAAKIQCLLRGTRTNKLFINIRAVDNNKEVIEKFRILVERLGDQTFGIKNYPSDPYCKLKDMKQGIDVDDAETILEKLKYAWTLINSVDGL